MTYHPHTINAAGMTTWLVGTATSIVSGLMAWADPSQAATSETVQRVQQGGIGLAIIGLLTVTVNFLGSFVTKFYQDRKDARDERRDIRERDKKVENLKAEVERHHQKNNESNLKVLNLQWQVEQLEGKVKTNAGTLRTLASASGDDLPVAEFDTGPDLPTIKEHPQP